MASAECEPITGLGDGAPMRGPAYRPGAKPLGRESVGEGYGESPSPEAESILSFRSANAQIYPFLLSCKLCKYTF